MERQNFRKHDHEVVRRFLEFRRSKDIARLPRLNLGWSNWGFGVEPLAVSAERLARNGVRYIELPGNLYGNDLGYKPEEVLKTLGEHGIKVSGICGMIYLDNEFANTNHFARQRAIDYMRTHIEFCAAVGGKYILFGPCAVGRPNKYDDNEFQRAADTMRVLGDDFVRSGIRALLSLCGETR